MAAGAPYGAALGWNLMPKRRVPSTALAELHECDGCGATMVASRGELHAVYGWRVHSGTKKGGKTWRLVLCGACSAASQPTEALDLPAA